MYYYLNRCMQSVGTQHPAPGTDMSRSFVFAVLVYYYASHVARDLDVKHYCESDIIDRLIKQREPARSAPVGRTEFKCLQTLIRSTSYYRSNHPICVCL